MDEHNKSTELGLQTEGSYLSESEIKDLAQDDENVDYPMPGETETEDEKSPHPHKMPENAQFIDEEGNKIA